MKQKLRSEDEPASIRLEGAQMRGLVNRDRASAFAIRHGISHLQACRLLARYGSDPDKLDAVLQRLKDDN